MLMAVQNGHYSLKYEGQSLLTHGRATLTNSAQTNPQLAMFCTIKFILKPLVKNMYSNLNLEFKRRASFQLSGHGFRLQFC